MVEKLVSCVESGSMPSLRRVGEARASRMGRRDFVDLLANDHVSTRYTGESPFRRRLYMNRKSY